MLKITLLISTVTTMCVLVGCSQFPPASYSDLNPINLKTEQPLSSSDAKSISKKQAKELVARINDNPQFIFQVQPAELAVILGNPALIKSDQLTEVWQFRGACTLDVVWNKQQPTKTKQSASDIVANQVTSLLKKGSSLNGSSSGPQYNMVWLSAFNLRKQPISTLACFNKLKRL